ncbi:MAG TPA: hypothetical protein VGG39_37085 [Polyangiaceae bacterium]|jgi:hypothetical protein
MARIFFALLVVEVPDDPTLPPRRFAAMGVTAISGDSDPLEVDADARSSRADDDAWCAPLARE